MVPFGSGRNSEPPPRPEGAGGRAFSAATQVFTIALGAFSASATPQLPKASVPWGRSQPAAACLSPFPASQRRMFSPSRFFLLIQIKRRAGAFVALDPAFRAPISTDVVRPRASKWADPKGRHPSPAREPRVGARHKRADCRKITSALRSNAFRAYFFTDGRQPFVPAASATPACCEPILRFPFSRRNGGSSAHIGAPPSSGDENVTRTKAACQVNS